jgi:hypothetical protein
MFGTEGGAHGQRSPRWVGAIGLTAPLRHILAGALGFGAPAFPGSADGKKHKHKMKIKRNSFGFVDVGKFCKKAGAMLFGHPRRYEGQEEVLSP